MFLCGSVRDLLICCSGPFKCEIYKEIFDALAAGAVKADSVVARANFDTLAAFGVNAQ